MGVKMLSRSEPARIEEENYDQISQIDQGADSARSHSTSKYYHHAACWVGKVKAVYLTAGREKEWEAYLSSLLSIHGKKYKLVPMLEALQ